MLSPISRVLPSQAIPLRLANIGAVPCELSENHFNAFTATSSMKVLVNDATEPARVGGNTEKGKKKEIR